MILVGRKAPDFTAPCVLPSGKIIDALNFNDTVKNQYAAIIFYPSDFTSKCVSELISLNKYADKLKSLGVVVLSISVDSQFTHNAWRNASADKNGIGPVSYTMIADTDHSIVKTWGVQASQGMSYRATFLMDKKGIVRHQLVNDDSLIRNMKTLIPMVESLQQYDDNLAY